MNRKRVFCFCIVVCLLLGLTACGKNAPEINSIEDLEGKRVATPLGTTYVDIIKEHPILKTCSLSEVIMDADSLALLKSGQVDAAVTDYIVARNMLNSNEGLKILDKSLDDEEYGILFPKFSDLTPQVNKILGEMKDNFLLDDMLDKWLGNDAKVTIRQNWAGTNGVLKCLVVANAEPMCYYDENGELQGFEIELMLRVARELNMKIEFEDLDFNELIPALMMGEADCGIGRATITEKRAGLVDFSDPYVHAGTVVVVRDANVENTKVFSIKRSFYKTFIEDDNWKAFASGLGVTLAFCAVTAVSILIFAIGGFLLTYSGNKVVAKFFELMGKFYPYLPPSIWILFVYYAFFAPNGIPSFIGGMVALTLFIGVNLHNDILGAINSVEKGQVEAATSMGYSRFKALLKIYIPQAFPKIIAGLQGEATALVKLSSLLEFIAVTDLQTVSDSIRAKSFEAFLPLAVGAMLYWTFAFLLSKLIGKIKLRDLSQEHSEEELMKKYVKEESYD